MEKDLFPIRLREARLMMNLSMDKLAGQTDGTITKQSVSIYEKGVMRPKHDALTSIAKALNISVEYFHGTNMHIDMPMLSREHYDWWYNERIKKNDRETGWGDYKFPETIGRERRIESRIENEGERQ